MSSDITEAIDDACYADQEGSRPHLGASQIGTDCARELVYSWRHALTIKFEGRMTRLFKRGHYEEPLVINHLRRIGFIIRPYGQRLSFHPPSGSYRADEWETPQWPNTIDVTCIPEHVWIANEQFGIKLKQWRFKEFGGHFAGSGDGKIILPQESLYNFAGVPKGVWGLFENKTYNEKQFAKLLECGQDHRKLQVFKRKHYDQMQEYMHRFELPFAIYFAVCKNDDHNHTIIVPYVHDVAIKATERARSTLLARQLPNRISNYPGWHGCRFCDYKQVCHYGAPLEKKCRTCRHVIPVENERFLCSRFNSLIPLDVIPKGCDNWEVVTD